MNVSSEKLIAAIVEGMQERKAKNIVTVDMTQLDAPCSNFVICEGESSVQVYAIAEAVKDFVRVSINERPFATDGWENSQWIVLDYGSVIVHVFYGETREFYDIEHLWADAQITEIPDLD